MFNTKRIVSITGLGYVGLPLAVAFGCLQKTVGFDVNRKRIEELRSGYDRTGEISKTDLEQSRLIYTDNPEDLIQANFHIVAVPTPTNNANQPDLTPVLKASEAIGKNLKRGDIVIYESTVYPGVTEDECLPILERLSGLKSGIDFKIGYSPERINPGDPERTVDKIIKIVSGQDDEALEIIAQTYGQVVKAGIHRASSIKVAEAAKVIENTQRDLNIALMNEIALICHRLNIDTTEVLEAASTKWNFLKFKPGLVGGHCIGVDPYYLTHKAEKLGYHPQVILAGRRINDGMGRFVVEQTIKQMLLSGQSVRQNTVTILGLTFKENCPDIRNSKVWDIYKELSEYGFDVQVCDPLVDLEEAHKVYGIRLCRRENLKPASAVIIAVAHDEFRSLTEDDLKNLSVEGGVIMDLKSLYQPLAFKNSTLKFWRL